MDVYSNIQRSQALTAQQPAASPGINVSSLPVPLDAGDELNIQYMQPAILDYFIHALPLERRLKT
jgi:hypothetical protein